MQIPSSDVMFCGSDSFGSDPPSLAVGLLAPGSARVGFAAGRSVYNGDGDLEQPSCRLRSHAVVLADIMRYQLLRCCNRKKMEVST